VKGAAAYIQFIRYVFNSFAKASSDCYDSIGQTVNSRHAVQQQQGTVAERRRVLCGVVITDCLSCVPAAEIIM